MLERVQELLLFGLASPALTETWRAARPSRPLDSSSSDPAPPSRIRVTPPPSADDAVTASSNAARGESKGRR